MQFNTYSANGYEDDTLPPQGEYKEAGESDLQYLPSTATCLVAVTTYADCRDHIIETANLKDDKIKLLLNARSNDGDAFTSLIMHFMIDRYKISDREEALKWLGIVRRPLSPLMDADQIEYIDEHERTVMS